MAKRLFYSDGLFFSCTRCSTCCRYESGYVFLSEKDLDLLAAEQEMRRGDFIKTYCRWVRPEGGKEYLSLKEKTGYDCVFWKNGCAVYRSRPLQCRSFPFWDSVLSSRASWEAAGRDAGVPGTKFPDNGSRAFQPSAPRFGLPGGRVLFCVHP